jgi:hypothetical protein
MFFFRNYYHLMMQQPITVDEQSEAHVVLTASVRAVIGSSNLDGHVFGCHAV